VARSDALAPEDARASDSPIVPYRTGVRKAPLVGAAGELGLFQLQPDGGTGERFVDAGWNLLDARENVVAAALVVTRDGSSSWSACVP
jgi:hypothetical protein